MEEIKSVKLRDNLKIHQRQTGHMVTSIQMMRNLFFAVANIISEHQSICKKILRQTEMVNFIPFTQTSSHELYGYFSDNKTNSRLKLDRLFWRQHQRQALSFNYSKTSWNSFLVTHNIGLKHISHALWSFIWCLLIAKSRKLDSKMFAYIFLRYDILYFSIAARNHIFENT